MIHFTEQKTDPIIPQGGVLSVTIFPVVIKGILRKLGKGVDGSLFADDLAK